VYPNGISTSLPFDVQYEMVRSIRGFEQAHLTRPGYAIEYDFFDPRDLAASLQTRAIGGLFFAGQINGTTGYEEAAAQGLLAGINAVQQIRGQAPWIPQRSEAYLGVLVDDLITRGATEPYRMFTSRAEHRLLLREDNADLRLTPIGHELGLVDEARWRLFNERAALTRAELTRLSASRVKPEQVPSPWSERVLAGVAPARDYSALELLRRPGVSYADVVELVGAPPWEQVDERLPAQVALQMEVTAKYEGYIERQHQEVERQSRSEATRMPVGLDYGRIPGLSTEVRQRLSEVRPASLGQAARIPGVTPAAISILLVYLKKHSGSRVA
jgi:tRNA uridine 5-carboxymethylaminomethyl modification enzyme